MNSINAGHDEEAARVAAANAAFLQYKNDPELYIFMHDFDDPVRKESARKEIDNIIDSFRERGQHFKAHGQPDAPALPPTTGTTAPAAAVSALLANPTEAMKRAFEEKYGYLPEGM